MHSTKRGCIDLVAVWIHVSFHLYYFLLSSVQLSFLIPTFSSSLHHAKPTGRQRQPVHARAEGVPLQAVPCVGGRRRRNARRLGRGNQAGVAAEVSGESESANPG